MLSRKWLVGICLLLLFAGILYGQEAAATEIEDLDEDHWAYESVVYLIEEGYMSLYADKTFRGGEPVSRYTLANVLEKILKDMDEGLITPTDDDLDLLRKLGKEFRDELVSIGTDIEAVEERIAELEDRDEIYQLRQAGFRDDLDSFADELDRIVLQVQEGDEKQEEQEEKITSIYEDMQNIKSDLDGAFSEMSELASRLEDVEDRDPVDQELVAQLREEEQESLDRIRGLERKFENLRREFTEYQREKESEIQALKQSRSNMLLYSAGAVLLLLITIL